MVKFIMKIYHDFRPMMVPVDMWGAFQALGLEFELDPRSEPYRLLFDEESPTGSAASRQVWSVDLPLD
jgi:hypothetical protein